MTPIAAFSRLLYLHLTCVVSFFAAPAAAAIPIYLGHLRPMSGSWPGGPLMEAAVVMALEDINSNATLLPRHTLARSFKDTRCNAGDGLRGLIELLFDSTKQVVGILGAGCSVVSKPVTATAAQFNLISVSPASGAVALSNKQECKRRS